MSSKCSPGSPRPSAMFRALGSFPSTNHGHGSSPAHDHASRARVTNTVVLQGPRSRLFSEHEPRTRVYPLSIRPYPFENLSFILSPLSFYDFPCQPRDISLECLKFYSGDNHGFGWGPNRITSTNHEHVFCPCHDHGSSLVHDHVSRTTGLSFILLPLSFRKGRLPAFSF